LDCTYVLPADGFFDYYLWNCLDHAYSILFMRTNFVSALLMDWHRLSNIILLRIVIIRSTVIRLVIVILSNLLLKISHLQWNRHNWVGQMRMWVIQKKRGMWESTITPNTTMEYPLPRQVLAAPFTSQHRQINK
jgi:hypothetical protein